MGKEKLRGKGVEATAGQCYVMLFLLSLIGRLRWKLELGDDGVTNLYCQYKCPFSTNGQYR